MGIFGPFSRKDWVWAYFCAGRDNAKFIRRGIFKGPKIEYSFRNWLMVTDMISDDDHDDIRIRVSFVRKEAFNFKLSRNTIFSGVAALFGVDYIKTENAAFDKKFTIKSGDSEKVARLLFTNEKIGDLLLKMNGIYYITIKHSNGFMSSFADEVAQIYFLKSYIGEDEKELTDIFNLLEEMLLALAQNGIISEQAPNVTI